MLGVHEDVRRRIPCGWRADGETVLLLGETRPEFGGSAWACVVHGHLGGRPPAVDLAAERALGELLGEPRPDGLVSSAHDLADGGLAQTLAESALRYGVGARLHLDGDPFTALFSESAARAVVTTSDPAAVRGRGRARPACRSPSWGRRAATACAVDGLLELALAELRAAWSATLPALFGDARGQRVGAVPAGAVPTS